MLSSVLNRKPITLDGHSIYHYNILFQYYYNKFWIYE